MNDWIQRTMWTSLFACLSLAAAGCGGGDRPELARVTGTVTRGGKPVPNILVHFQPDSGRPSYGLTDDAGRFRLHYSAEQSGARFGPHSVYVEFNQAQPASFAGSGEPEEENLQATLDGDTAAAAAPAPVELTETERQAILDKYGTLQKSPLKINIDKDGQTVDIQLD